MNKNIVLDFTQGKSIDGITIIQQDKAILPAALAKKLLARYVGDLENTPVSQVIRDHAEALLKYAADKDLGAAMKISLEWIAERTLIHDILGGEWEKYTVVPQEDEITDMEDHQ